MYQKKKNNNNNNQDKNETGKKVQVSCHFYTCDESRGAGNMDRENCCGTNCVDNLFRSVVCWKYIYAQLGIWLNLFQGGGSDYHIEVTVKMKTSPRSVI